MLSYSSNYPNRTNPTKHIDLTVEPFIFFFFSVSDLTTVKFLEPEYSAILYLPLLLLFVLHVLNVNSVVVNYSE